MAWSSERIFIGFIAKQAMNNIQSALQQNYREHIMSCSRKEGQSPLPRESLLPQLKYHAGDMALSTSKASHAA